MMKMSQVVVSVVMIIIELLGETVPPMIMAVVVGIMPVAKH